ncbi:MAG TPA: hypothetical protein HPP77_10665 [Candidatus Hydrogenedentes bacterium]|nr:hypothetical protein [Candidatus Hydrogenedentota bacterium]HIJ74766.1 hypothetical protein [Candidatus Hydrogenedentota bacterium]
MGSRLTGYVPRAAIGLILVVLAAEATAFADTLSEGVFHIEYAERDAAVARESLGILEETAAELDERLPLGEDPVRVVIAATSQEFRQYTVHFNDVRVSGVAESAHGLIVMKSPRLLPPDADYVGILRHEFIHILLHRNVAVDNMPRWLNEGTAMIVSKERRLTNSLHVARMYVQGRLLTYAQLNQAMSGSGRAGVLSDAYAQSLSMTRFLIERLGEDGFWDLLHALDTMTFREALETKASWTPQQFIEAWQRSLWAIALASALMSGFTLFQVMAILAVIGYLRKRRQARKLLRRWDDEERDFPRPHAWEDPDAAYVWEYDEDDA